MPIFEYNCKQCNHQVDKLSKVKRTDVVCDVCGETMNAALTVPAFQFKNGAGTGLGNLMSCPSNPPKTL